MVSRQVYTAGLLAGLLCFAIIDLSNAAPVFDEGTSLAVRNPYGTNVAEYVDQAELVKRVNVKLFATALGALGGISYTACAADIEPTTKAAICVRYPHFNGTASSYSYPPLGNCCHWNCH